MTTTDRSLVEWEAYPGATNDIDRLAEEAGGWVCEDHPDRPWGGDDPDGCQCGAAGMLAPSAR